MGRPHGARGRADRAAALQIRRCAGHRARGAGRRRRGARHRRAALHQRPLASGDRRRGLRRAPRPGRPRRAARRTSCDAFARPACAWASAPTAMPRWCAPMPSSPSYIAMGAVYPDHAQADGDRAAGRRAARGLRAPDARLSAGRHRRHRRERACPRCWPPASARWRGARAGRGRRSGGHRHGMDRRRRCRTAGGPGLAGPAMTRPQRQAHAASPRRPFPPAPSRPHSSFLHRLRPPHRPATMTLLPTPRPAPATARDRRETFVATPVAGAAATLLWLAASAASAQTAPAPATATATAGDATLSPVTVDARAAAPQADVSGFGDLPLREVPLSATVIDSATLQRLRRAPPGRPDAVRRLRHRRVQLARLLGLPDGARLRARQPLQLPPRGPADQRRNLDPAGQQGARRDPARHQRHPGRHQRAGRAGQLRRQAADRARPARGARSRSPGAAACSARSTWAGASAPTASSATA